MIYFSYYVVAASKQHHITGWFCKFTANDSQVRNSGFYIPHQIITVSVSYVPSRRHPQPYDCKRLVHYLIVLIFWSDFPFRRTNPYVRLRWCNSVRPWWRHHHLTTLCNHLLRNPIWRHHRWCHHSHNNILCYHPDLTLVVVHTLAVFPTRYHWFCNIII